MEATSLQATRGLKKRVGVTASLNARRAGLEYVGVGGGLWTGACVQRFEQSESLGKLNCPVGKWTESLGNRP